MQLFWKGKCYIEGSVFWKSDSSKKAAFQKKYVIQSITFLNYYLFPICSFPENVDAVQKYLLWKSSSSVDLFFLTKKIDISKINCPK